MKGSAELFKLLSVDKRIEIIELLKKEPISVNALANALGITQSAVSQHLRVLRSAGFVKNERQGYWIYYSLNRDTLEKCRERLNRICTCGCLGGHVKIKQMHKGIAKPK
ncbi:MAG: winged helix-turn-helix transcriptional regulator [Nitrospirae bacterium]|nr:winged helix-turn-helix transcriptional regulator [Nitrospirota bacterium]